MNKLWFHFQAHSAENFCLIEIKIFISSFKCRQFNVSWTKKQKTKLWFFLILNYYWNRTTLLCLYLKWNKNNNNNINYYYYFYIFYKLGNFIYLKKRIKIKVKSNKFIFKLFIIIRAKLLFLFVSNIYIIMRNIYFI